MLLFNYSRSYSRKDGKKFKYIQCYCSTLDEQGISDAEWEFKYIQCYCSTKIESSEMYLESNLNTSNVIVQPSGTKRFRNAAKI